MKIVLGIVSFLSLSAVSATKPMLEMWSMNGGLLPIENTMENTCQVFEDKIRVTRIVAGVETKQTFAMDMKGDLAGLIKEAGLGKVVDRPASTDGPITRFIAYQEKDGNTVEIKLLSRGSEDIRNDAPAAGALKNLLETHCPIDDFTK